jgi:hypothetical protein
LFAGASGQLQDTWVKDVTPSTNASFAATPTGWTNDEVALEWIQKVFDPITKPKARREKRLLIVDGHGSHLNMRFLDWCNNHSIIVACYPPHTTHRLQPLDVSLFAPLAVRYSQQLERYNQQSLGISRVSKRDFFRLFEPAFEQAFTADNIHSAFAKTGIHPLDSLAVLSDIRSAGSSRPATATSSDKNNTIKKVKKQVRFIDGLKHKSKKQLGLHQEQTELNSVKDCLQSLVAETKLQKSQIEGLQHALFNEQNKRTKGKTLFQAVRAENPGGVLVFSPGGIQQARDLSDTREAAKHAAKEAKLAAKEAKAIAKQQQVIAKQQQALARQDQQQKKAIESANRKTLQQRLKEVQQANNQLLSDIQTAAKTPRKAHKNKQPPVMAISSPVPPNSAEELDQITTRSGRVSKPSLRRKAPNSYAK